jgi:hypothetical protein
MTSWVLQTGKKLVLHCWAIDCCNCKHKQKDFLHSERVSEGDRFGLHLVFEPVHDRFITTSFLQEWEVCVQEKPVVTSYKQQTIHRDIGLHHTKHHREKISKANCSSIKMFLSSSSTIKFKYSARQKKKKKKKKKKQRGHQGTSGKCQ